ncbi:DNA mismatch endonuclease Vsr [Alcaligenaceae bacterium]|nr:DNA mismatch endonuclease Vsr [Alcaligenaceae bacterium]
MADVFTKEDRSKVMSRVKGKDTAPELKVRRLLHAFGYRYKTHAKDMTGKPDIVFTRRKVVIFIHGCFWHQHQGCKAAVRPSSNTEYWQKKLARKFHYCCREG